MLSPSSKTILCQISSILIVLFLIRKVTCENSWQDATCATLFSGANFDEEAFILKGWDHIGMTEMDYRSSTEGWGNTSSIRVEEKCSLTVCDDTHFEGNCRKLSKGDYTSSEINSHLKSAKCVCERVCRCEDVLVPKSSWFCGRAYIFSNCNDCNSKYAYLWHDGGSDLEELGNETKVFKMRKGCNVTVWSEQDRTDPSTVLTGEFAEYSKTVGSYQCSCDDDKFDPPSALHSPLISLPSTEEELLKLASNLPHHPGITAAIKSKKAVRSWKNAYIILIGSEEPGNILCTNRYYHDLGTISEFHIPLYHDVVGVSNAQLRFITVPIGLYGNFTDDDRWIATLDEYLSSHEDLKDTIPNAVVTVDFESTFNKNNKNKEKTWIQRKLRVVNALRYRLVDENYSNVIHVKMVDPFLQALRPPRFNAEDHDDVMNEFHQEIENNWDFPKPTFIVRRNIITWTPSPIYFLNEYYLMWNGGYACQNIFRTLILLSEKAGDALGNEIFKAIYASNDGFFGFRNRSVSLFPIDHPKVDRYRQTSVSGILSNNKTSFTKSSDPQKAPVPTTVTPAHTDAKLIATTNNTTLADSMIAMVQNMLQNLTERVIVLENETLERISRIEKRIERWEESQGGGSPTNSTIDLVEN